MPGAGARRVGGAVRGDLVLNPNASAGGTAAWAYTPTGWKAIVCAA